MNFPVSGTIMKTQQFLRTLATTVLLGGAPVSLLAQGPLTPPGPPAPMMKTLVEMEPRTHIVSLPFTITAPGSYYLTTNLNGGGSSTGIVIQASGVTIDLRGFAIENCSSGISASGMGVKEVAIHNGGVRGCTGNGIDLGGVGKVRVENVMLSDNSGDGASVGEASLVTLCTAKGNGGNGIVLGSSGKVFQCVSQSNGGSGISVASSCQIADNNCNNNGSGAGLVTIGAGNRVEGNSSNQNKFGFLINGSANLVIRNNACSNTAADYSVSTGNNYGQVLVSPGAAFASSNAWANFGCGTPGGGACATAADCDDGDACTTDVCQAAVCINTPIPDCGMPVCGNGMIDAGELCDGANLGGQTCSSLGFTGGTLACSTNCTYNTNNCSAGACGDGIVQAGEACDDGNLADNDGCSSNCQLEGCNTAGDCPGMDTECQFRTCSAGVCGISYSASGTTVSSQTPGDCQQTVCNGTGNVVNVPNDADLPADDGNQCTSEVCNAGNPNSQNLPEGTACSQNGGVICDGSGTCISNAVCGDGIPQAGESCDDGNLTNGDGCTATCSVQSGYSCAGSPSACVDINECLTSNGGCSMNAACTNTVGSNTCTCTAGYVGDGITCTAINYMLTTAKTGTGSGTVTSAPSGIFCGADCTEAYSSGTLVSLSAAAQSGSSFAGWSGGGCSGFGTCSVTMNSAKTVTALFTLNTYPLTVTKAGPGSGTITSSPAGINCGATCTNNYNSGTNVTLTAASTAGSSFTGWSGGGCSGTGTCVVSMTSAQSVTATFN